MKAYQKRYCGCINKLQYRLLSYKVYGDTAFILLFVFYSLYVLFMGCFHVMESLKGMQKSIQLSSLKVKKKKNKAADNAAAAIV